MPRRIFPTRKPGITDRKAAFWRGDTAEKVLAERVAATPTPRRRRASTPRGSGPTSDPAAQIRRLERAIPRRKTQEARDRLQARIDSLRKELA